MRVAEDALDFAGFTGRTAVLAELVLVKVKPWQAVEANRDIRWVAHIAPCGALVTGVVCRRQ